MSTALTIIPTLNLNSPAQLDDAAVGRELTALYNDAEMSILRFGAAFYAVEKIVNATRGVNSPKRGPGSYGFANWLAEHSPEIAEGTARRYRDIAEAVAQKFKIADPVKFFNAPAAELDEKDQAKRAKVIDFVADKSVRGLQLELGLVANRGGDNAKRDAAGNRLPAANPKEINCPPWATEGEKALWATLQTDNQKLAFIDWRPRIAQMANQVADVRTGWLADMDQHTKNDLIATLVEVLKFVAPSRLKS